MIKENKKTIIICALIMFIPVLAGILLWNKLPEQIPTHWNAVGEVDQYSNKAFAIFGLNAILYATFAICIFGTASDPKRNNISKKMINICLGIIPVISLFTNGFTIGWALGIEISVLFVVRILIGITFIIIGNYMPKTSQSYTVGIKIPWTLNSEDNWKRTHRFAGKVWVLIGLLILLDAFINVIPFEIELILIVLVAIIPMAYSYIYYLRNEKKAN